MILKGFDHTHNRPDRDKYIKVFPDNVECIYT